ncbi:uncharacterized protein LOC103313057 [Tribolium castaneum]|uniref:SIAH-type domain-containing protein n=1 Tax=Tribolium castaneum TaxID=7070 RepID=D6WLK5_TRICA|nr:hypothetical protein TcasGA2_TC013427 [Tribolium castaneum]
MAGPSVLKCSRCNHPLSYFPIYQNGNNELICGRCPQPRGANCVRVTCYEVLAFKQEFPCRFAPEGCKENIGPEIAPQHERNCPFRKINKCPTALFTQCSWEGKAVDFTLHCFDDHKEHFARNNSLELSLFESGEYYKIVPCGKEIFIVRIRFDALQNVLFSTAVFCGHEANSGKFTCEVIVEDEAKTLELTLPLVRNFDSVHDTKLELHSLELTAPHIVVKIEIADKSQEKKKSLPSEQVLAYLRCPICKCLMRTPMLFYLGGPTLCRDCNQCLQYFNGRMINVQNFGLHNLIKLGANRCKFYGCDFVANEGDIVDHENNCLFKERIDAWALRIRTLFGRAVGPERVIANRLLDF